jgi:hypothetical protein
MAFTQSDLDTLDAAIKSGVTEVRFQDRTVRYKSLADMMQERTLIYTALNPGGDAGPGPIRQYRIFTDRGW